MVIITRSRELGLAVWERSVKLYIYWNWSLRDIIDQIEKDEADIVTPTNYACYHGRGTVAICAPGTFYLPHFWFSKHPEKRSPVWNLVMIFTPTSWIFTFLSILSVSLFFFVSARIGASYFGLQTIRREVILSPFRSTLTNINMI